MVAFVDRPWDWPMGQEVPPGFLGRVMGVASGYMQSGSKMNPKNVTVWDLFQIGRNQCGLTADGFLCLNRPCTGSLYSSFYGQN